MSRWFSRLERINVTFGGCAYLTVPFKLRIERHRIDVARGQTAKVEARRFLNYDEEAFLQWDGCLRELLAQHIPNVQEIAATYNVNQVAQHVIEHIEYCRHIGAIS
jgi:hypothetical protein